MKTGGVWRNRTGIGMFSAASDRDYTDAADRHSAVDPCAIERADDERFAGDYSALVASFLAELGVTSRHRLISRIAYVLQFGGSGLVQNEFLLQFREDHGEPAVLRALATAIEQQERQ